MLARFALVLPTVVFLLPLPGSPADERGEDFKQVEEAVNQRLPRTAIAQLKAIGDSALNQKDYPRALRAIQWRLDLESQLEGNRDEERVARWEAELAKAPAAIAPMMHLALADRYRQLSGSLRRSRWDSKAMAGETGSAQDAETWELIRVWAETDKHLCRALESEAQLKAAPCSEYGPALEIGYRRRNPILPTLYDYAACVALDFYSAETRGSPEPEDAFELEADGPVFAPFEEFLKWEIRSTDRQSPALKAIRLYQELLRFHQNDPREEAFVDADVRRLKFGYEKAVGKNRSARYKAALKRHIERWSESVYSTIARAELARVLWAEGDPAEAHRVAAGGWTQAFQSRTSESWRCWELMQQIELPAASVAAEHVWNEPWPSIRVRYRNLTRIHFRIIRGEWPEAQERGSRSTRRKEDPDLLKQPPELEWSTALPATPDFKTRLEDVPAPRNLKPGFYYLVASTDPKFSDKGAITDWRTFWISDLAIVTKVRQGDGALRGFVLDARSGEPIEGADVQAWLWSRGPDPNLQPGPKDRTDANGRFSLLAGEDQSIRACIHASHNGRQLASPGPYYNSREGDDHYAYVSGSLFTDRSIYRPGQTIHYKGITYRIDRSIDRYETESNHEVHICLRDTAGRLVAENRHKTNSFGSFSGSFTAPRDRLCGRMSICGDRGYATVHVEEYKRPKFQVSLEAPKAAVSLDGQVCLEGTATAYTGMPLGGASVRYRVARTVQFAEWWRRWYDWDDPGNVDREIAHATVQTDVNGRFFVRFPVRPDRKVDETEDPTFEFTVSADVTDTTGETCSAERKIKVGHRALRAALAADEWLTDREPVAIRIATRTLDDVPVPARGVLRIHRLQQPQTVYRPCLFDYHFRNDLWSHELQRAGRPDAVPDPGRPSLWKPAETIIESKIATDAAGSAVFSVQLPPGAYLAQLETQDAFGSPVAARLPIQVISPESRTLPLKIPFFVAARQSACEPGDEFTAVWGTACERARAFVEIEHRGRAIESYWTDPGKTQQAIRLAVTEAMRGGFTMHVTMVRDNRGYLASRRIHVPWTNKKLNVRWEHFVSKLQPARRETWTAVIIGPDSKGAKAEMAAVLYDRALDAYVPHAWKADWGMLRQDWWRTHFQFDNAAAEFTLCNAGSGRYGCPSLIPAPRSNAAAADFWGYEKQFGTLRFCGGRGPFATREETRHATSLANGVNGFFVSYAPSEIRKPARVGLKPGPSGQAQAGSESPQDLECVTARKRLDETAFFFPHLTSNEDGRVKIEFTSPEALTAWKFIGIAHDPQLRTGLLSGDAFTTKDLMVQPNPPRFLREGDVLEFTVKVANQSDRPQSGKVRLTFANARTGKPVDSSLGNAQPERSFDVPARQSRSYAWRLTVPDRAEGVLTYKTVAATDRLSDGEEAYLPILSRRVLVSESLPLPLRGPQTGEFSLPRLLRSGQSKTIRHQSLTVQMTSHPSWYAIMSLPCLMEYPWEGSEQTFNRFYAGAIARYIIRSNPKIRRVFEQWRETPALDSPLEKNQELKSLVLEETPWVSDARAESQARRNLGLLFDDHHLRATLDSSLQRLGELRRQDGTWPWFAGGPRDEYITLYIAAGFGRLRRLGVKISDDDRRLDTILDFGGREAMLERLDAWAQLEHARIVAERQPQQNHLSPIIAFHLYGRSFFLDDHPIAAPGKAAVEYFLSQAREYWNLLDRQSQGHVALALDRFGDKATAQAIVKSLKERAVRSEELGMSWRDEELLPWWYRAPIETQTVMIEAFDEVAHDRQAVEDCKVWLLKHKQVHGWHTTKATADAVYALLLRGDDPLTSDEEVAVTLGKTAIRPENVEAGTGFFERRFVRQEVKPEMGRITVAKSGPGIAWGSVHWHYLDDIDKVPAYRGTPLKISKSLFRRQNTKDGPSIEPIRGPIRVGDEIVVRLLVQTDREMEYVHLKDQRPSGVEPLPSLSRICYRNGIAYYEVNRDSATHFFFARVPRGTHKLDYGLRVVHQGQYPSGMASIECLYAPEFNGHSESLPLVVRQAD